MAVDVQSVPGGVPATGGTIVLGEVVIASDYFKTFVAWLRKLFGGELRTYETMMSRARREAKLRMLEQADDFGAELVVNVRFEWSDVGPRMPSAEILCYGTAILD